MTVAVSPSPKVITGADLLARARSYKGRYTDEEADDLARQVGVRWPEMADYATEAKPGTHWCGIFDAVIVSEYDMRPPFGPGALDRWMWVDSWKTFGTPVPVDERQPGDICGWLGNPHHVAICAGGDKYVGGNQTGPEGDTVTETVFRTPDFVRRPPFLTPVAEETPHFDPAEMPLLNFGDTGPYVEKVQQELGVEVDGEFGKDTEAAVRAFQAQHPHLEVDGEVGPQTWAALFGLAPPVSDEPARYVEYKAGYAADWERMKIDADKEAAVAKIAQTLHANKARYVDASESTGVPWFVIAAWHWRESSGDFDTQLAQGDPLNAVSIHKPSGRGPFSTWEEGAYDALVTLKALNTVTDWTIERIAYESERYNGFGYRSRGVPSAYLWSFSNIYQGGKFVSDGNFSMSKRDEQSGVMPIVKALAALDSSITLRSYKDLPPPDEEEEEDLDPEVTALERRLDQLMAEVEKLRIDIASTKERRAMATDDRTQIDWGEILAPILKALLPELMKILPRLLPALLPALAPLLINIITGRLPAVFAQTSQPKTSIPPGTIPGALGLIGGLISAVLTSRGVFPPGVGDMATAGSLAVGGAGGIQAGAHLAKQKQ